MPAPLYIICSESGADDRISGQTSIFNVIERINFAKVPPGTIHVGGMNLRITAAWRREEGDEGRVFEFEAGVWATDDTLHVFAKGEFIFEHPIQKIGARIVGSLPLTKSGILRAFVRIRSGNSVAEEWLTQQYPIDVVEVEFSPPGDTAGVQPTAT